MSTVPIFTTALVRTECDICDYRFDPIHGGVCDRCKRILCMKHLHGSWLRRLRVDLGAQSICVECRAGVYEGKLGAAPTENSSEATINEK